LARGPKWQWRFEQMYMCKWWAEAADFGFGIIDLIGARSSGLGEAGTRRETTCEAGAPVSACLGRTPGHERAGREGVNGGAAGSGGGLWTEIVGEPELIYKQPGCELSDSFVILRRGENEGS
jgi:hypothetical protein